MLVKDIFTTLDTSTNATKYTTKLAYKNHSGISWHIVATGSSLTSAITFWASNLPNPSVSDDTDWVQQTDITLTGPTTASSFKGMAVVGNCNAQWYRVKIVTSNGTGAATVYAHTGKQE